jgi:hypothetical protein
MARGHGAALTGLGPKTTGVSGRTGTGSRHSGGGGQSQVVACLGVIDEALQRLSGAPDIALTVLDGSGHCLVAGVTAQSILVPCVLDPDRFP